MVAPVPPGSDLSKALKFDFVMPFCVVAALLGRFGATPPGRSTRSSIRRGQAGPLPEPFHRGPPPIWRHDYPLVSFLYFHLVRYPVHGRVYPFPFETSPEAVRYASELSGRVLSPSQKFIINGGDRAVLFWRGWFGAARNWRAGAFVRSGRSARFAVLVFEKGT